MATEKRLIDANALLEAIKFEHDRIMQDPETSNNMKWCEAVCNHRVTEAIERSPTVDAVEVVHGQRLYNAHEVAVIIANLFGDDCACSFNNIDEWLPLECELQDACPNPPGVACWEQYLKFRDAKMDGGKDNG